MAFTFNNSTDPDDPAVNVGNTIIANNNTTNCNVALTSNGYNLEDTDTCGFSETGDIPNSTPFNLGALGDNLGPTHTHALLTGSAAIDVIPDTVGGCDAGVSVDQRGAVRAGGSANYGGTACDIGAFEYDSNFDPTALTLVNFEERRHYLAR